MSHYQVALVLLAVLPLIVVFGLMAWRQGETLRESINRGMLTTADALSLAVDREVATVRESLQTLAASETIQRGDFEAFYREASHLTARRPGSWVVLVHRSGQFLVNTSLPYGTPLPNRFREEAQSDPETGLPLGMVKYLKQVLDTGKPANTNLFISIVHRRPVIAVNVPIFTNGAVDYVVSITLEPHALTDLLRAGLYDHAGGAALLDADGFIITRTQNPERFVGKKAPASLAVPAAGELRGFGVGTTVDNQVIYRAYARSPVTGWVVSNGMRQADFERRIAADLATTGFVGLVGLGLGVLLALWFGYRLHMPMVAVARKAAGMPLPPRVQGFISSELVDIGRAIDAAAEARDAQARERELRIAAEARKVEADAANRSKDQFLATLGHELRNPLAAIVNAVAVLERNASSGISMLPILKRQSEHLRKLVDDLLDVARVTSGKIRLHREDVDLFDVVAGSVDSIVSTGRSANVQVTVEGESVVVHADRHRIMQVCTNLLDNALKFTPEGGRVTVRVHSSGEDAVLEVEDTGAGIAPQALTRIFEVFEQGDDADDRSRSGLGLGLALVKALVEMHHGTVSARSEGVGKGATFTVVLPRVKHQQD